MNDHYDDLEIRDPEVRQSALFEALAGQIWLARKAPGWNRHLGNVDPAEVNSRKALATMPVLRKTDLTGFQKAEPPFGGFALGGPENWGRVFMSPGPIFEPMGLEADPWRSARALFAAGFRAGDIVHNSFAYHLTPGGFILDAGARALGCAVLPAGIGNSEQQIEAIAALQPSGFTGTPDFLKILLDKAEQGGRSLSSIKRALVSGGALFPSLREEYAKRGISVLQCYATADVGVIAYESEAMEGMIVDEGVILEIVRPGTGDPVDDGEVGEVVVTNFNSTYPMIRLATGDLSAIMSGTSPCGRTNIRIKGWMGRADQTTKVKGMFVHPSQVAEIAGRHLELGKLRLVVSRANEQDELTLYAECGKSSPQLADKVALSLHSICKVRGRVEFAEPGTLPNDGKVIADDRPATT